MDLRVAGGHHGPGGGRRRHVGVPGRTVLAIHGPLLQSDTLRAAHDVGRRPRHVRVVARLGDAAALPGDDG